MDAKTVSIIIPVYNVRDYLRKCLDSVAAQTYRYLEVVIVNDGSPDDSLQIIEEYTAKYPHFHCYTIENRGLGGARNYGMEQATGDYLLFLDNCAPLPRSYEAIENIVLDEAELFFNGTYTAEQAVERIDNRVQLYLDESK